MRQESMRLLNVIRWPHWLQNAMLVVVGVLAAYLAAPFASQHPATLLQLAIVLSVMLPGFVMASSMSGRFIPYILLIWAIGPELRRLEDWMMGAYDAVNIVSLSPVLATALALLLFLKKPFTIQPAAIPGMKAFAIPFLYASAIGLLANKLAGIYSMLNYLAPALILVYLAIHPPTERQKDAWVRFYITLAVLLSIYAWVQYLILPPWDRLWMEGARMVSMGKPEPLMFRAFSTLNANGTFAVFLTAALVPAIVSRRWRGPFGLPGVMLMLSALAVTLVRASWVTLIASLASYFLFASHVKRWRIVATVAVMAAAGAWLLPLLPGGQQMADRMETLGSLQSDHSASSRWQLVLYAIPEIAKNPIGSGFGSIGKSAELNGGGAEAGLGSVDNGYLGVFATFGIFGGILFFRALIVQWRMVSGRPKTDRYRALGLAMIVQLWVGFMFGGELVGLGAVNFWLFTSLVFTRTGPGPDQ